MGVFVHLFGEIAKKQSVGSELNALKEIDRQRDTQYSDDKVADDAEIGPVAFRDLDRLQGVQHFL